MKKFMNPEAEIILLNLNDAITVSDEENYLLPDHDALLPETDIGF